jgi:hypothetical protein
MITIAMGIGYIIPSAWMRKLRPKEMTCSRSIPVSDEAMIHSNPD